MPSRSLVAALTSAMVASALTIVPAQAVHGLTLVVDSVADAVDLLPGDEVCATAAGECTLRAAIQEANAHPGPDTIELQLPTDASGGALPIALTIAGEGEDASATGDLDVNEDLLIRGVADGTGARPVIDASGLGNDRGLSVLDGSLELTNLAVVGGYSAGNGGNLYSGPGTALLLERVTVSDGRADGSGGGLHAEDEVTIRSSAFTGNTSGSDGGAVHLLLPLSDASDPLQTAFATPEAVITSTHFEDNGASRAGGAIAVGDTGDNLARAGDLLLANSTFVRTAGAAVPVPTSGGFVHHGARRSVVVVASTSFSGGRAIGNGGALALDVTAMGVDDAQYRLLGVTVTRPAGTTFSAGAGGALHANQSVFVTGCCSTPFVDHLLTHTGEAPTNERRTSLDGRTLGSGGAITVDFTDASDQLTLLDTDLSGSANQGGALAANNGNGSVSLVRATVTGGSANTGGGVRTRADLSAVDTVFTSNTVSNVGSAIHTDASGGAGTVTLERVAFRNNAGPAGAGVVQAMGPDVYATDVVLVDSIGTGGTGAPVPLHGFNLDGGVLYGDRVLVAGNPGSGIVAAGGGEVLVEQSTVSSNGEYGVLIVGNTEMDLTHVTVTDNGVGGLLIDPAAPWAGLFASVVADNGASDCAAGAALVTSTGHALVGADCAGYAADATDVAIGTDPGLLPLADLGWRRAGGGIAEFATRVHPLAPDSPLVDAVPDGAPECLASVHDQRGLERSGVGAGCDIGALEAPALDLDFQITGDNSDPLGTPPSLVEVRSPSAGVPTSALTPSSLSASASPETSLAAAPLASIPLASIPLASIPLASIPLASIELAELPLASIALDSLLLVDVPIVTEPDAEGRVGWEAVLAGTKFASEPLQTIRLVDVLAEAQVDPNLDGSLAALPLASIDLADTPLASIPLASIALGATPLASIPLASIPLASIGDLNAVLGAWCAEIDALAVATGSPDCAELALTTETLDDWNVTALGLAGVPLASIPLASIPLASIPLASIPLASIPLASIEMWASPLASIPLASIDLGATPLASIPLASIPLASIPLASIPLASIGVGSTPLASIPLASIPLASIPLASIPLASIPLASIPLASIPLASIPLASIDLASTPLASIPLASVHLASIGELSGIIDCANVDCDTATLGEADAAGALLGTLSELLALNPDAFAGLHVEDLLGGAYELTALRGLLGPGVIGDLGTTLGEVSDWLRAFTIEGGEFSLCVDLEAGNCPGLTADQVAAIQLWLADTELSEVVAWALFTLLDLEYELWPDWQEFTLVELLGALDPELLEEFTIGDILATVLGPIGVPWHQVPVEDLAEVIAEAANPSYFSDAQIPTIGYAMTGEVVGVLGKQSVDLVVEMPEGFLYAPGSSQAISKGGSFGFTSPIDDPVVDGSTLVYESRTAGSDIGIRFAGIAGFDLGLDRIQASVRFPDIGNEASVRRPIETVEAFEEWRATGLPFDPVTDAVSVNADWQGTTDRVFATHLGLPGDLDTFSVDLNVGDQLTVGLGNLPADYDVTVFGPGGDWLDHPVDRERSVPDDGRSIIGRSEPASPMLAEDVIRLQGRPVVARGALRGLDDEELTTSPVSQAGRYLVMVSGYNGASDPFEPYVLRVGVTAAVDEGACPDFSYSTPLGAAGTPGSLPAGVNTLFLLNEMRTQARFGGSSVTDIKAGIDALAGVAGVVPGILSLDGVPAVNAAYGAWDAAVANCQVGKANDVVREIAAVVRAVRTANPSIEHVVVVGADDLVPFARMEDVTTLANESTYRQTFAGNSALAASLGTSHFLSDDVYADATSVLVEGRELFVPEVGIGRLVEDLDDITGALAKFVTYGGVLDNDTQSTTLVTGYDFLTDGANAVADALAVSREGGDARTLINETWTDAQVDAALEDASLDVAAVNAHFDHHRALPGAPHLAGTEDDLFTVDHILGDATDTGALEGTIVFSMGCHSGLSVSDVQIAVGENTDWAQTFASRGALYAGNTGYGYGDTEAVALSERLMAHFARRLDGSTTLGLAMAGAKQRYAADLGSYGAYDEKVLMQVVLYGLPMYEVGRTPAATPEPPYVTPGVDPSSGLTVFDLDLDYSINTPVPGATELVPVSTGRGTFWAVDGDRLDGVQVSPWRAIQPREAIDVTAAGELARGALITSLRSTNIALDPVISRPTIDLAANEPEPVNTDTVFPAALQRLSSYAELGERRDQVVVVPGQFLGEVGATEGVQRLFTEVGVRVFYDDGSGDVTPPTILRSDATRYGQQAVRFRVELEDNLDAERVLVLFADSSTSTSQWQRVELTLEDGIWSTFAGLQGATQIDYFVQAVDAHGNVAVSTNKGTLFRATLPEAITVDGFSIDLVDAAGNVVAPGSVVDADRVTVDVTTDGSGDAYVAQVRLDGGAWRPVSDLPLVVDAPGPHRVEARDSAGRHTRVEFLLGAVPDLVPPTVEITSPAEGTVVAVGTDLAVDHACGDDIAVATCEVVTDVDTATAGVREVVVTATDTAGNETTATRTYVVYDPDAGFVAGGGKVWSPAGALASAPDAEGPAQFALVSRYKKGAKVPSGTTHFRFAAGDFTFEATLYDWLVVAGAKAQYKGEGTVNGRSGYGFLVTAVDGDLLGGNHADRLRMKVWSLTDGGVVYDNQGGASEQDSPGAGQDLTHGQVLVKTRKK